MQATAKMYILRSYTETKTHLGVRTDGYARDENFVIFHLTTTATVATGHRVQLPLLAGQLGRG